MTNRDQLQREPPPVVITTPPHGKIPVRVAEKEEPLSTLIRRLGRIPATCRELLILQESGQDERSTYGTFTR